MHWLFRVARIGSEHAWHGVLALSSLNDAQAYALALRRTLPQLLGRAKFGPTTPWPGTS